MHSNDPKKTRLNILDDGLGILPCKSGKEGYYSIPSYRKYCVSRHGSVHRCDRPDISLLPQRRSREDGRKDLPCYKMFFFRQDQTGLKKNVARHRIVLAAHKGFPDDPTKTTVNHINGIPGDDRLENLEWSTQAENNQHAIDTGLRRLVPMERWHLESNVITRYTSVPEFVRQTGVPKGTILKRLATDNAKIYSDGCRYRYIRDEWSDTPQSVFEAQLNTSGKEVLVLDYRDEKIYLYESGYHVARKYGIEHKDTVNTLTRKKHTMPYCGCIFRTVTTDEITHWPEPTEDQKRALKMQGYPMVFTPWVILIDSETNQEAFIGSFIDAEVFTGLAVGSIRNACHRGIRVGKYRAILIKKDFDAPN